MQKIRSLVESKVNPLALLGPLYLALSIALLWVLSKDLTSLLPISGLIGLAVTWVGGRTGLWVALSGVLLSLIASIWMEPLDSYWQTGFAFSMMLSLIVTSLNQAETVDKITLTEKLLQERSAEHTQINLALALAQSSLQEKEAYLAIARDEFLNLQQQQRQWSDAVFEERRKHFKTQEFLEDQVVDIMDSSEYRRLNGFYLQLKEQFKEKDQILAETRKNLFGAQEEVHLLMKELEEHRVYGVPTEIARLEQHCVKLEQHYSQEISRLQAEVEALEELIR